MLDPRRQFGVLYFSFLRRTIDLDVLSAQGDGNKLLIQFVALLGAFSLVYSISAVPQYWLSTLSPKQLALAGVGDQEFLIATTMAVVGIFATLSWGAVFADRRDVQVLGLLPVRDRTIFSAKVASIATGLIVSVVASTHLPDSRIRQRLLETLRDS